MGRSASSAAARAAAEQPDDERPVEGDVSRAVPERGILTLVIRGVTLEDAHDIAGLVRLGPEGKPETLLAFESLDAAWQADHASEPVKV